MTETIRSVGRPRYPLMYGQQCYAKVAFSYARIPHSRIASYIGVSLPRVTRFLTESGLHIPKRHHTAAHINSVLQGVQMYEDGVPVADILGQTNLPVSELYKGLRQYKIPLRMRKN